MVPTLSFARKGARPLRIALVSVHGDPLMPLGTEEAGGQNVYVRELAKALTEIGHQVDVFTRSREGREVELHPMGDARVIRLPAGPAGFVPRTQLFEHLPAFVERMGDFARWQGALYDVLHTNYWLSGWVGLRLSTRWELPHVHTHHSLGAVKFAAEGRSPANGLVRLEVEEGLMRRASWVVATSPNEEATLRKLYGGTGQIARIPCGIDPAIFQPQDSGRARDAWGLPRGVPLVAYVGRFHPSKGIETLVEAIALLEESRGVHLVLVGGESTADGGELHRIRALVEQRSLSARTTFLGRVQPHALASVYAAADLCVVPSHYESFGLVAIESMGCGTPVVASRVGGLQSSVLDGATGWLVPARDPRAFARACARILDDPALRSRMADRAFAHVREHFTWGAVAAQLERLYVTRQERGAQA